MKENIITSLKELRRILNIYLVTLGYLALEFWASGGLKRATLFRIEVPANKYSLAFGVLFALFFVMVTLKLRALRDLLMLAKKHQTADFAFTAMELRLYPWTLSPFQESRVGRGGFWTSIVAGFIYLACLSLAHIIRGETMSEFQIIGVVDLCILFAMTYLLSIVYYYVRDVRHIIESINIETTLRNTGNSLRS